MLEQWLDQLWIVAATGIGIFVAVNALFFKSDDFFSKEFKEDVSLRLLCLEGQNPKSSWTEFFVQLFDWLFSKKVRPGDPPLPEWRKHLSWTCFWRSGVASLTAVVVVLLIRVTTTDVLERDSPEAMILVLPLGILMNVLPDYVSLLETRYLLYFVRVRPSLPRIAGVLVVDVFATATIFVFLGFGLLGCIVGSEQSWPRYYLNLATEWEKLLWLKPTEPVHVSPEWVFSALGILFYSTFFTSVWLWLFALSQLLLRLLSKVEPLRRFLLEYMLPVEERPFRSIGIIAALIAMLGYWVLVVVGLDGTTVAPT